MMDREMGERETAREIGPKRAPNGVECFLRGVGVAAATAADAVASDPEILVGAGVVSMILGVVSGIFTTPWPLAWTPADEISAALIVVPVLGGAGIGVVKGVQGLAELGRQEIEREL